MKTKKTKLLLFFLLFFYWTHSEPVSAQPLGQGGEHFITQQGEEMPRGEGFRRRRGWLSEEGIEQRRALRQQRLDRARTIARRLLEDPNTPADVKTKAQRLNELLTKRENLEHNLQGKRQDFLQAHRQELEELRQLRERADVIRQDLRAAREKATAENLSEIQEMRRVTQEARETAQEIRQYYRGRRGGRSQKPEDN
jgi:hypothetical protein